MTNMKTINNERFQTIIQPLLALRLNTSPRLEFSTIPIHQEYEAADLLLYELGPHPEISPDETKSILQNAVLDALKVEKPLAKDFEKAYHHYKSEYLKQRPTVFTFFDTLLIAPRSFSIPRVIRRRINEVNISILEQFPKKTKIPEAVLESMAVAPSPWTKFLCVIARTRARTMRDAKRRTEDALDLLRAKWNYVINYSGGVDLNFSDSFATINSMVAGSAFSILDETGQKCWNESRYMPSSFIPQSPRQIESFKKIEEFERFANRRIAGSHLQAFIERVLRFYCRTLDRPNPENVFLRLWTLMEILTLIESNDKHEVVVARSMKMMRSEFKDKHSYRLNVIRGIRNRIVHDGDFPSEMSSLCSMVKYYVEILVRFYLDGSSKFRTVDDIRYYLDLPDNIEVLKSRRKAIDLYLSRIDRA